MAMRLLPAFGFCLQPGIQSEGDWSATDDVTSHDQQQQQPAVTNDSDDDTVGAPPGYVDYTDVKNVFTFSGHIAGNPRHAVQRRDHVYCCRCSVVCVCFYLSQP